MNQAANLKCKRSIAFVDCFALAMGETMGCPALSATREAELMKEIKKEPFKVEIVFLDEIVHRNLKHSEFSFERKHEKGHKQ